VNLDDVREILELMRDNGLSEFEIERDGLKLRLRKDSTGSVVSAPIVAAAYTQSGGIAPQAANPAASAAAAPAPAEVGGAEIEMAVVKSPIVGTFYRSSEPGAAAFVEIGANVKKGQVLCIIEAMKLMNEIDSEFDGEIVNVYVENGQPVQYGERLFAIKTA
jgi:acetyl-CoA carboxylase biotin carboxyl carrier protein